MMSEHNVQNNKMYMKDIEKLPVYQGLIKVYGKIPKKEKIVEIVDGFSSKYGIKVDNSMRSNRIKCLLWLNMYWNCVENFIRPQKCSTFVDVNKYKPVNLENEREETTTNVQQSITIQRNVGKNTINQPELVKVEIDYQNYYEIKFMEGDLPEDNGIYY